MVPLDSAPRLPAWRQRPLPRGQASLQASLQALPPTSRCWALQPSLAPALCRQRSAPRPRPPQRGSMHSASSLAPQHQHHHHRHCQPPIFACGEKSVSWPIRRSPPCARFGRHAPVACCALAVAVCAPLGPRRRPHLQLRRCGGTHSTAWARGSAQPSDGRGGGGRWVMGCPAASALGVPCSQARACTAPMQPPAGRWGRAGPHCGPSQLR